RRGADSQGGSHPVGTMSEADPDWGFIEPTGERLLSQLRQIAAERRVEIPEFVLPGEATIDAGRLPIHFLDWGGAGKPPVVFLHGGRLNAHSWDIVCLA